MNWIPLHRGDKNRSKLSHNVSMRCMYVKKSDGINNTARQIFYGRINEDLQLKPNFIFYVSAK